MSAANVPDAGGALVVFAKWPEPGRVKTRLSPPFSPEAATEFYGCMLDDVLDTTLRAATALGLAPCIAVDPPLARDAMARRAPAGYRVVAQSGADLGARMDRIVAECAAAGLGRVLLRGSDSPALDGGLLEAACRALDRADLVACPDPDGGYSVIGLREARPGCFDHAMSHDGVLEQTLAAARRAGLTTSLVEPCFDVDTARDLERLAERRARPGPLPCPRTLAWLDQHHAWPDAAA